MTSALRITIQPLVEATFSLHEDPGAKKFPHLISFGDPDDIEPPGLNNRHCLRILCHDIDWEFTELPGLTQPSPEQAASIIAFGREVLAQAEAAGETRSVLLHCRAGISRSTAGALILLYLDECRGNSAGAENRAMQRLLRERPEALPNRNLTRFADEMLGSTLFEFGEDIHRARAAELKELIRKLQ